MSQQLKLPQDKLSLVTVMCKQLQISVQFNSSFLRRKLRTRPRVVAQIYSIWLMKTGAYLENNGKGDRVKA